MAAPQIIPMHQRPQPAATGGKAGKSEAKFTPQGHFCVWHGMSFGNWAKFLATQPPIHWSSLLRMGSITACSLINSWHNCLESAIFGRKVARQEIHPPVFVLGHWRSGTTLLHNLLTLDPQFTSPNLYNVMYPRNFLLTEWITKRLTSWIVPKTRPMDNMPTGWDHPQEDEMALLLLTLISPYLMLGHQVDRSQYARFFQMTDLTESERALWQGEFKLFLKRLTVRENKPIILKSPTHTFRVPVLLEMFPDAKFVYIYRDPYAVYNSGMHLRRSLFKENGLGLPNFNGMEEDVLRVYTDCIDTYEGTKHLIPEGNLHEMRFEDLEADPLGQMHDVYQQLNLGGWDGVEPAIRNELPTIVKYRKNSFHMDEDLMRVVYSRWKSSFDRYGYSSRLVDPALLRASG